MADIPGRRAAWALVVPLALVAFHRGYVLWLGATPLGVITLPELALYVAVLAIVVDRRSRAVLPAAVGPRLRLTWLVFIACAVLSFAVHPTGFGITAVARLLTIGVIVGEVARQIRIGRWHPITLPLASAMVVQAGIAIVQRVHGGPLGLAGLGERRSGFKPLGSALLPAGTTVHTNTLGLYGVAVAALIVAATVDRSTRGDGIESLPRGLIAVELVGLLASGVCVGLTGSRTAAIALALLLAAAAYQLRSTREASLAGAFGAITLSAIVTGMFSASIWLGRAHQTSGASIEQLGSGRMALIRQSLAVFRLSPVTGVGPGNYLVHVLLDPAIIRYSHEGAPVHNVWLSVLATYGLLGIAAFAVMTGMLLGAGRRAGIVGALIGLPALVTLGLDVATTLSPGFLLLAVSLGAIVGAERTPHLADGGPPSASPTTAIAGARSTAVPDVDLVGAGSLRAESFGLPASASLQKERLRRRFQPGAADALRHASAAART